MAHTQAEPPAKGTISTDNGGPMQNFLRRFHLFPQSKNTEASTPSEPTARGPGSQQQQDDTRGGPFRRLSRKVVPGLPRAQTFKRQQSELRDKLEPVRTTPAERRALSVDRRVNAPSNSAFSHHSNPRTSAPDFLDRSFSADRAPPTAPSLPTSPFMRSVAAVPSGLDADIESIDDDFAPEQDARSVTTSQYNHMIHDELARIWILNLSMHFRDKSKREKFFVTYRQQETLWRRVTISLDYRNAPEGSLEMDLAHTEFQRDKSAKIYEAIRESLPDIQFYNTVTNLKLQTTDGRLHVHVVEDVNEIINYPTIRMIQHLRCRRVKEREIEFDSHMSGFVYKVRVHGQTLIKKEIPGPDTVDEFLYEINALNSLRHAKHVIQFYGVVVDDREEQVKGLLISYAEQGALIDVIYDNDHSWATREKWARQIVAGLSEIHEAGFVQGDFTLSNIVINEHDDAKIIDINRRGCPVGWEPPEVTPLIDSNQRICMYIGVKSDLYQLGMVLWALAMQDDEPELHGRPLRIGPEVKGVPPWYRNMVEICLSEDPQHRVQALHLLSWFEDNLHDAPCQSATSFPYSQSSYLTPSNGIPQIKTVHPPSDWGYVGWTEPSDAQSQATEEVYDFPTRGRSPPSRDRDFDPRYGHRWSDRFGPQPSASDIAPSKIGEHMESVFSDSPKTNEEVVGREGTNGVRRAPERDESRIPEPTSTGPLATAEVPPRELGTPEAIHCGINSSTPEARTIQRSAHKFDSLSPATDYTEQTEPESRADSGKDVTDPARTDPARTDPASSRKSGEAGLDSFVGSEPHGVESVKSSGDRSPIARSPLARSPLARSPPPQVVREPPAWAVGSNFPSDKLETFAALPLPRPSHRETPRFSGQPVPLATGLGMSDTLKGIGGAYDTSPINEKLQEEILEDELNLESSLSPGRSLAFVGMGVE